MKIQLTEAMAELLQSRQQAAATALAAARAAQETAQVAQGALNDVVSALAVQGGAQRGALFDSATIQRAGERIFLVITETPQSVDVPGAAK